jgi:hypothetical protein
MTDPTEPLAFLSERKRTHGDFADVSRCAQNFKEIARSSPAWPRMTPVQREGIEMILHKICRALSGDPNFRDHYIDAAGYGLRIAETLSEDPPPDSLTAIIERQRAFSLQAFGEGARTKGILEHISHEVEEVAAAPDDISEWVDLVLLSLDGAWRSGHSPAEIVAAITGKITTNAARTWPSGSDDRAIFHERDFAMTLCWFGSFKKTAWEVGKAREAVGACGRYQIRRDADGFVVRWCPPFRCPDVPWQDIGTTATETEAIALAETHNNANKET